MYGSALDETVRFTVCDQRLPQASSAGVAFTRFLSIRRSVQWMSSSRRPRLEATGYLPLVEPTAGLERKEKKMALSLLMMVVVVMLLLTTISKISTMRTMCVFVAARWTRLSESWFAINTSHKHQVPGWHLLEPPTNIKCRGGCSH